MKLRILSGILYQHLVHILYICDMIQRRQTIYLLLATIIAALLLILNLEYYTTSGVLENGETEVFKVGFFTTEVVDEAKLNNTSLIGGLAAYAGVCFITIFMFKNRKNQVLACTLGFALLLFSAVMMYRYSFGNDYLVEVTSENIQWPAIIPMSLFILQFLALKGIKQDEALVKSLDRIR